MEREIKDLESLINQSPSPYHLVEHLEKKLKEKNAKELKLNSEWNNLDSGIYYVREGKSSLIAFELNSKEKNEGFLITAAHTDSPALKLKLNSINREYELYSNHIEVYGGPIISTWLDRDLSLAGLVFYKSESEIKESLINIENLAIIPNLAIHLNREVNKGFEYHLHEHLKLIYSQKRDIKEIIATTLKVKREDILSSDLAFYSAEKLSFNGYEREFISSQRLDNQAMCHSIFEAFLSSKSDKNKVAVFFDNEEIGSQTSRGADSNFLINVLERITLSLNLTREEFLIKMKNSLLISADCAHASHPAYKDVNERDYPIIFGEGLALKINSNFRYASTAKGIAKIKNLALENKIKIQEMIMRANIRSGSTIGAMTNAITGIETIDLGTPLLAMHSIRETISRADHLSSISLLKSFYERGL